jgi:hypothetical protein
MEMDRCGVLHTSTCKIYGISQCLACVNLQNCGTSQSFRSAFERCMNTKKDCRTDFVVVQSEVISFEAEYFDLTFCPSFSLKAFFSIHQIRTNSKLQATTNPRETWFSLWYPLISNTIASDSSCQLSSPRG